MNRIGFVWATNTSPASGAYDLVFDTALNTLRLQLFGVEVPVGNQSTGVTFSLMIVGSR